VKHIYEGRKIYLFWYKHNVHDLFTDSTYNREYTLRTGFFHNLYYRSIDICQITLKREHPKTVTLKYKYREASPNDGDTF